MASPLLLARGEGQGEESSSPLLAPHSSLLTPVPSARPGFLIDYDLQGSQTNLTLEGGTTYYVLDTVTVSGTLTPEGSAVVKYGNSGACKIVCLGPVVSRTGPYHPIIFTARDDDSVGTVLTNSTHTVSGYYASPALELRANGQSLHDLRVSYATVGLYFYDFSAGYNSNIVAHAQFVGCNKAFQANGYGTTFQNLYLRNALIHNCSRAVYGYSFTSRVEHLTLHNCAQAAEDYNGSLYGTTSTLCLTNSLFVAVSAYGNVTVSTNACAAATSSNGVFQTVGAGGFYLLPDSPYRGAGTDAIQPALLAELRQKTTWPPLVTEAAYLDGSQTLVPVAARDLSTPALGYHYSPLDRVYRRVALSNATLTVSAGTALGVFGYESEYGLLLMRGASLVCAGTPDAPVRIVRYNLVQEQGTTNWACSAVAPAITTYCQSATPAPQARFRFTHWGMPAGGGNHFNGWEPLGTPIQFRNCEFRGGELVTSLAGVGATNNLFHRVAVSVDDGWETVDLGLWNNLHYGGSLSLTHGGDGAWTVKDCLFDLVGIAQDGDITNGCNGYVTNATFQTRLSPQTGGDVLLSAFTFTNGPLGDFYQVSTNLVNRGSRSAATALYHYTVLASQTKETNSTVDLGYHCVALGTNGLPADADGDGLPDYAEDQDGDGTRTGSETDWTDPDTDYDGRSDAQELADGTDPLDPDSVKPVRLGYWQFDGTYSNDQGQAPLATTNVQLVTSYSGTALQLTNSGAAIRFRDVEPNGCANINLRKGSIRFTYLPYWFRHTNAGGPGDWVRLIEIGDWKVTLSPDGVWLFFQTKDTSGNVVTNLQAWAGFSDDDGLSDWSRISNYFAHEIALHYSPDRSWLEVDGTLSPHGTNGILGPNYWGGGVSSVPSRETRAGGFSLGSASNGLYVAKGCIDDLETFNFHPTPNDSAWGSLWHTPAREAGVFSAAALEEPSRLRLNWVQTWGYPPYWDAACHELRRRVAGTENWETRASGLTTNACTDTVDTGVYYEYEVGAPDPNLGGATRTLYGAVRGAPVEYRGRIMLVVDETLSSVLATNLDQLRLDLLGDGWAVTNVTAPRHDDNAWVGGATNQAWMSNVATVKGMVTNAYWQATNDLKALFLIGHVVVPYSGSTAEDGHSANNADPLYHAGAWPADAYYGDVDGLWSDNQDASRPDAPNAAWESRLALTNIIGDGKWDQNTLPTNATGQAALELAVGRVDFARLPAFSNALPPGTATNDTNIEIALLKRYLGKTHNYRQKLLTWENPIQYFTTDGRFAVLAANAGTLLTRLWGGDLPDIATGDVFATAQPTLWGVHGGSGSAVHIAYASTVTNNTFEWLYHESASFATAPPPIFFCLLSGSSFVDWNLASNNLMKSCLASADYGLAAVWCFNAVAPNGWWRFERLAMGHPLACMLADTFKAYESGVSCRSTYILGDPTLRMQIVAPPANLARCAPSNQVTLTWQASVDPVLGYWMYRSPSPDVPFTNRVSATLIGGTSFTDPSPPSGLHIYYLVRAAKLETSGSGSFTNLSQGAMTYVE